MKTKEELNALKEEVETVNKKLAELTEEELAQVCGGRAKAVALMGGVTPFTIDDSSNEHPFDIHIYPTETEEEAKRKFFGE